MIDITIQEDENGFVRSFAASGHAGYAPAGSDIICAAVTALAATTVGSLQELAHMEPASILADGQIEITIPEPNRLSDHARQTAAVLMQSLVIGCRQIQASYGSRYIRIQTGTKYGRKNR